MVRERGESGHEPRHFFRCRRKTPSERASAERRRETLALRDPKQTHHIVELDAVLEAEVVKLLVSCNGGLCRVGIEREGSR